jgi:hypothetical protein
MSATKNKHETRFSERVFETSMLMKRTHIRDTSQLLLFLFGSFVSEEKFWLNKYQTLSLKINALCRVAIYSATASTPLPAG